MTRLFCRLAVVLLLAAAPIASSQPALYAAEKSTAVQELETLASRFFVLLTTGDVNAAFSELLKNSAIAENREQVQQLISQTEKTITLYGDVKSYELVSVDTLAQSFVRMRYIALHEDYPVRWILTYYKSPSKGWLITNIKFDDRAEELFPEK